MARPVANVIPARCGKRASSKPASPTRCRRDTRVASSLADADRRARNADASLAVGHASDARQLEGGMAQIDACHEAQHIQLEAFVGGGRHTEEAMQRHLVA